MTGITPACLFISLLCLSQAARSQDDQGLNDSIKIAFKSVVDGIFLKNVRVDLPDSTYKSGFPNFYSSIKHDASISFVRSPRNWDEYLDDFISKKKSGRGKRFRKTVLNLHGKDLLMEECEVRDKERKKRYVVQVYCFQFNGQLVVASARFPLESKNITGPLLLKSIKSLRSM